MNPPRTTSFGVAAWTLCRRELVRFYRQRSRVIGVIGSPLVFWFLIGSGLGKSFRPVGAPEGMSPLEFFFPGTLLLIVLFTAIFSTISIIEDRSEGFLQSVLVAPVSRAGIVLGKMLGGTLLSLIQVPVVLVLLPLMGVRLGIEALLATAGTLVVVSFGLTGLGFLMAWRLDSVQGFHALMNLLLMPMWMLSGAFFPASGAPGWLRAVMAANPLTYALAALRRSLYLGSSRIEAAGTALPAFGLSLAVSGAFAALTFAWAVRVAERTSAGDLH